MLVDHLYFSFKTQFVQAAGRSCDLVQGDPENRIAVFIQELSPVAMRRDLEKLSQGAEIHARMVE